MPMRREVRKRKTMTRQVRRRGKFIRDVIAMDLQPSVNVWNMHERILVALGVQRALRDADALLLIHDLPRTRRRNGCVWLLFLRNGPNEACAPTLVAKDRRTKLLMSHVVPCKGADQAWVVVQTLRDLERLGHYGDIVLRSDGEPALVDLMKKLQRAEATGAL